MKLATLLLSLARRMRVYASFRESGAGRGHQREEELDLASDFLREAASHYEASYHSLRLSPNDPPDCIARTNHGDPVAIEVTELVSEEAVRINEQLRAKLNRHPSIDEMVMAQWDPTALVSSISERLNEKDRKVLKGGCYSEYIVLIHTDEPLLDHVQAVHWLSSVQFAPLQQVTSGYLMFSYQPGEGYPLIRLSLAGPRAP